MSTFSWNINILWQIFRFIDVFSYLIYFNLHVELVLSCFLPITLINPCSNPYVLSAWNFDLVLFVLTIFIHVMTALKDSLYVQTVFMIITGF